MAVPTNFTTNGVLPAGTHDATFSEIRSSILISGNGSPAWDSKWRSNLLDNAEVLVNELWAAGVQQVYLDGSFVEDKDRPNDIDGYFDTGLTTSVQDLQKFSVMVQALNLANPYKVWTWDPAKRVAVAGFPKRQLPMWVQYRVELYPHLQQLSGIQDVHGNDLTFPSAFRQSRSSGIPKGIIRVTKVGAQ